MAQGCILFLTKKDISGLRKSLQRKGFEIGPQNFLNEKLEEIRRRHVKGDTSISDNEKSLLKHAMSLKVEQTAKANPNISPYTSSCLPKALKIIFDHSPYLTGIFESRKGETALIGNLSHRTRGEAFAYECTALAEVIQKSKDHNKGLKSVNGSPNLKIKNVSGCYLGRRFQANYGEAGKSMQLYSPDGTGKNKNILRRTVEADALILKPNGDIEGIDFKHTKGDEYPFNKDMRSQLEGVTNAILTGDFDNFSFVTNRKFSPSMEKAVEEANNVIMVAQQEIYNEETTEVEAKNNRELEKKRSVFVPHIGLYENINFHA